VPAYVVVSVDVHDPDRYAEYVARAPESVARYGGRYVARGGRTEVLEGDWDPKRFVVLEFPSFEDAQAWWHSQEYADAKALRHATATSRMILVDGVP
jgi:uncharacterized protein (DUF1330 family)